MRLRKLLATGFVLVTVAAYSSVLGQSRVNSSGNGGLHVIQGRVYLPSGKSLDSPIKVELQSNEQTPLSVQTDQNGSFRFGGIRPGNYSVIVDAGESFEIVKEYVTIDGEIQRDKSYARSTSKTFTVPMYLQPKRGAVYKSGIINAKWSGVPRTAIEHYEKGIEFLQVDKLTEAVEEFKQSIAAHRPFAPAHVDLGRVYLKKGLLDEAIASLRTGLQYDDKSFDARLNLGIALLNKMDLGGAEKELVEAAFMNSHAVTPHYYLGILFVEKKNYDVAQKAMEKAKELKGEKDYPLLHRYLGGIYLVKKMDKQALTELETYLRLQPDAKDAERIRRTITDLKSKTS